ncbi:MAG: preprotein translocase subunit SecY [Bdellovibrionota bacterium]
MSSLDSMGNIIKGSIPELKKRLIFTLLMLVVYRFGVFVPTPGVDVATLRARLGFGDSGSSGTIFDLFNMFSGGSFENFSIFTLGIMPYISVSIIIQFITPLFPALAALKKEGEAGRRILTRWTRQGTVVLALFQSCMIAIGLQKSHLVLTPGIGFIFLTMVTLTAGTAFIMWLGEQITEHGIGNGISIIIFAGIVARMPQVFGQTIALARGSVNPLLVILGILFCVATFFLIVFVEKSARKIPVQYPRRMVNNSMVSQKQVQYIPLKVNMAGVIPPIFASSLLMIPATIAGFVTNEKVKYFLSFLHPSNVWYNIVFAILIFIFCYYATAMMFNPEEMAENMQKNGGFIPTVRPGKETADFFFDILNKLTFWGGIYIAAICILPRIIYSQLGLEAFSYVFGGTSILIVVGVVLDTMNQIQSILVSRNYEEFMAKATKSKAGISGAFGHKGGKLFRR